MAHLLVIELPGGNDTDILDAAVALGHSYTFLSARLEHYRQQPAVWAALAGAREHIDLPGFAHEAVAARVLAVHERHALQAVICLIDIRLVEAARLARLLGVPHVSPASAALLRDKVSVRRRLAEHGIAQPAFELAESNAQLKAAVQRIGLPVLIKPADGYGSQNIVVLREPMGLDPLMTPLEDMLPSRADYGLGVRANDRLLVERYMSGALIGVDTLTVDGRHTVIGVHQKVLFAPPAFAMRGSTFLPNGTRHPTPPEIVGYVGAMLDAVGFDWGAAHIEMMLTEEGPRLVEINPRLVGAKIARLVNHTRGDSLHAALIRAHLGQRSHAAAGDHDVDLREVGVIRWIVSRTAGTLEAIELPRWSDARIRCVETLKRCGDLVGPPIENADRIGYVMVCGEDRSAAERLADRFVADTRIVVREEASIAAPAEALALSR